MFFSDDDTHGIPIRPLANTTNRPTGMQAVCDTIDMGRRLAICFSVACNSVCFVALVSELEEMRSEQPEPSVNISQA